MSAFAIAAQRFRTRLNLDSQSRDLMLKLDLVWGMGRLGAALTVSIAVSTSVTAQTQSNETGSLLGTSNLSAWSTTGGMAGELLPSQGVTGRDSQREVARPPNGTCTFSTDALCQQGVGAFVRGTLGGNIGTGF